MSVNPIIGLERGWRSLMRRLGQDHPQLVNRNRIVLRMIRQRQVRR